MQSVFNIVQFLLVWRNLLIISTVFNSYSVVDPLSIGICFPLPVDETVYINEIILIFPRNDSFHAVYNKFSFCITNVFFPEFDENDVVI